MLLTSIGALFSRSLIKYNRMLVIPAMIATIACLVIGIGWQLLSEMLR